MIYYLQMLLKRVVTVPPSGFLLRALQQLYSRHPAGVKKETAMRLTADRKSVV